MTSDYELQLWILDTLWEDIYSFVELSDYMANNSLHIDRLQNLLIDLVKKGYVEIKILDPEDNLREECKTLSYSDQQNVVGKFSSVSKSEVGKVNKHFLFLSNVGREYYKSMGFGES